MRDFIDPKHLLLKIDANFDFVILTEFIEAKYDPAVGRPAVHPEAGLSHVSWRSGASMLDAACLSVIPSLPQLASNLALGRRECMLTTHRR